MFLFLNYWLILFIDFTYTAITQVYNPIAEFVIPIRMPSKKVKAEI